VGVLLDEKLDAEVVARELKKQGVDTRPFFFPLHKQPLLSKFGLQDQASLPISEKLGKQGIYLPSFIGLDDSSIEYVSQQLLESIEF
jgi:perosamine synthetase